ncbi:MAG: tRNA dihydrouridine synthase DusB [Paracoccaceae bacterium]
MRIGDVLLKNRAILAPMAGITDLPFRRIAARFGAGLTISEMVASGELLTRGAGARARAELDPAAGIAAVQIAGREAAPMAEAARIAADSGARLIDINMGCPAKKVTSGWSGAALMREPDHALRLIDAVVGAVDLPVTLKMRLGWDETAITAPDLAQRAEAAGVRMITVHGRTRAQFYAGRADWSAVAAVRAAIGVPLVVNGDIVDAAGARRALALSGADAVMIGRGAQGAPWAPASVGGALAGLGGFVPPTGAALAALIIEHYEAMLGFYGPEMGMRVARKHLGWYLARLANGAPLRTRLMRMERPKAVIAEIRDFLPEAEDMGGRRAA